MSGMAGWIGNIGFTTGAVANRLSASAATAGRHP
jgi:hypothetical protein